MKTSVILAFTGKKGAEYLKKVKFPGKTIFFAFICGEKEIGGSYLPDCYPICESEDMDGKKKYAQDLKALFITLPCIIFWQKYIMSRLKTKKT